MKRLLCWAAVLTVAVGIGVASGALYWFAAGPGHQQETARATSSVDNTPPVFAPSGRVPLSESSFPLGYGCSGLDFNKVNAIVKR